MAADLAPRRSVSGTGRAVGARSGPSVRASRRLPGVTCVGLSVKALVAWGSGPEALVKVERPQRSEDVRS
jgi:hypothetical protein